MIKKNTTISNKLGLHARASAKLTRQGATVNDLTPQNDSVGRPLNDLPVEMQARLLTCSGQQG